MGRQSVEKQNVDLAVLVHGRVDPRIIPAGIDQGFRVPGGAVRAAPAALALAAAGGQGQGQGAYQYRRDSLSHRAVLSRVSYLLARRSCPPRAGRNGSIKKYDFSFSAEKSYVFRAYIKNRGRAVSLSLSWKLLLPAAGFMPAQCYYNTAPAPCQRRPAPFIICTDQQQTLCKTTKSLCNAQRFCLSAHHCCAKRQNRCATHNDFSKLHNPPERQPHINKARRIKRRAFAPGGRSMRPPAGFSPVARSACACRGCGSADA